MNLPEDPAPDPESRRRAAGTAVGKPAKPRREPLYFVVIVLLCADILFGLGLAVFAEKVLTFRPMAVMGVGLAVLGLGILAYFVLVGGRSRPDRRL